MLFDNKNKIINDFGNGYISKQEAQTRSDKLYKKLQDSEKKEMFDIILEEAGETKDKNFEELFALSQNKGFDETRLRFVEMYSHIKDDNRKSELWEETLIFIKSMEKLFQTEIENGTINQFFKAGGAEKELNKHEEVSTIQIKGYQIHVFDEYMRNNDLERLNIANCICKDEKGFYHYQGLDAYLPLTEFTETDGKMVEVKYPRSLQSAIKEFEYNVPVEVLKASEEKLKEIQSDKLLKQFEAAKEEMRKTCDDLLDAREQKADKKVLNNLEFKQAVAEDNFFTIKGKLAELKEAKTIKEFEHNATIEPLESPEQNHKEVPTSSKQQEIQKLREKRETMSKDKGLEL